MDQERRPEERNPAHVDTRGNRASRHIRRTKPHRAGIHAKHGAEPGRQKAAAKARACCRNHTIHATAQERLGQDRRREDEARGNPPAAAHHGKQLQQANRIQRSELHPKRGRQRTQLARELSTRRAGKTGWKGASNGYQRNQGFNVLAVKRREHRAAKLQVTRWA